MAESRCPMCGRRVADPGGAAPHSSRRCPGCGSPLELSGPEVSGAETIFYPESPEEESAEPAPAASGTLLLQEEDTSASARATRELGAHLVLQGASREPFPLTAARTVVGRQDSEITVDDPTLSSRHFEIEWRGAEFFIRDLESSNGTLLNGHPVRSAKLDSGDEIRAGRSTFTFRILEVVRIH